MTREDDGDYECISVNKHGNHSAVTRMNVLCKYIYECRRFEGFETDLLFFPLFFFLLSGAWIK